MVYYMGVDTTRETPEETTTMDFATMTEQELKLTIAGVTAELKNRDKFLARMQHIYRGTDMETLARDLATTTRRAANGGDWKDELTIEAEITRQRRFYV